MEAIGKLTGGVAHDFNNLLQVISGNLQLLARDVAGRERAEQRVAEAMAGVRQGARLASQLLAFSRRQPLEPKVVNVGRLVSGMGEMLRRTIGDGIEVETLVAGGLWNTMVDPVQLETAVLNLALNARDAMNAVGKLTIEAGNAVLDEVYARENEEVKPGQYAVLTVTDTGSGIAPELLDQVFEPFFSTKPQGKGTGLGLSMVYGFVKQSGGHVKIHSEPGQGTAVKLYLPRIRQGEDLPAAVEAGPVAGGTETILVAEDNDGVRATVVDMLVDLGYRVLTAKDAAGALGVIESGEAIDLLFTDIVMPGRLRSTELARMARERLPGIGVLFTSGYTENSIVHGGRLDAGIELLSKPYTREALARRVRAVLARSGCGRAPARGVAGLRVLVCEDDALIRLNTADMLQEAGATVIEAGSGAEALARLEGTPPDALVIDVGLPDMIGVELARRVREMLPEVPIVFATGHAEVPGIEGMARVETVRKPHGGRELCGSIERLISGATR
jgi:CheY-like chemotaxis protein